MIEFTGKGTEMTNAEYQKHRADADSNCLLSRLRALATEYNGTIDREGEVSDSAVRDLLTDIRHLCDMYGLDFGAIDTEAYEGYLEELTWRDDPNDALYVGAGPEDARG